MLQYFCLAGEFAERWRWEEREGKQLWPIYGSELQTDIYEGEARMERKICVENDMEVQV